jgi:hypothetical protein
MSQTISGIVKAKALFSYWMVGLVKNITVFLKAYKLLTNQNKVIIL